MKKNIAIIQARMGSTRMPGKTLKEILGKPTLWHLLENLKHSRLLTHTIVATTTNKEDDAIEAFARQYRVSCYRGSEKNVLQRFYEAAISVAATPSDTVVRITADDIFPDPEIIDALITVFDSTYPSYKLISNSFTPGFPYGLYFELFDFASLETAQQEAQTDYEREHVTPFIREHEERFPAIAITSKGVDLSDIYLSIDTPEDFDRNRSILEYLDAHHIPRPYRFRDVLVAYKKVQSKNV